MLDAKDQKKTATDIDAPVPGGTSTESLQAYEASKTFLARLPDPGVYKLRMTTIIAILAIFFVVIPLLTFAGVMPNYRLSILGKYLTFAIVALGIDLIWGYTGMLSLCQAIFFCIGGYAMAMHLSLPEGGGDHRIPQFMEFAYYGQHGTSSPSTAFMFAIFIGLYAAVLLASWFIFRSRGRALVFATSTELVAYGAWRLIKHLTYDGNHLGLPPFWRPFASLPFSIIAGLVLAAAVAGVFGFFIFRSRVRGVYFSIVTQAVALGAWLLICRNEMLLGGTNGLTNFYRPLTESRGCIMGLYFLTLIVLVLAYLLCRMLVRSRLGRIMVAVRDKESRLYFAGYQPYAFKVFAFVAAALLGAVGGMLYSPQFYDITPQNMDVAASITMVIFVALGGRGKLWGAVLGALLVNYTYSALTSDVPSLWPYVEGGMFIIVPLLFPDGFVAFWDKLEREIKSGAPALQLFFTALPLGTLSLFILGEALGLNSHLHLWKYFIVVVLLGSAVAYHFISKAKKAQRGFEVVTPTLAGTGAKA